MNLAVVVEKASRSIDDLGVRVHDDALGEELPRMRVRVERLLAQPIREYAKIPHCEPMARFSEFVDPSEVIGLRCRDLLHPVLCQLFSRPRRRREVPIGIATIVFLVGSAALLVQQPCLQHSTNACWLEKPVGLSLVHEEVDRSQRRLDSAAAVSCSRHDDEI